MDTRFKMCMAKCESALANNVRMMTRITCCESMDAEEQTRENPSMRAKRRSTNDVARMRTTRTDDENKCRGEVAKASTMSMNDGKMGTPQTNDSLTSVCMTRTNDSVGECV